MTRTAPGSGTSVAILAGGLSRRMGREKALLPFPDKPLVQVLAERFAPFAEEVFVVAKRPEAIRIPGLRVVGDLFSGNSSLVGLTSALAHSRSRLTFVIACDMPFVTPAVASRLLDAIGAEIAAVPTTAHGWEPLCALYRAEALGVLQDALAAGISRIRSALEGHPIMVLPPEAFPDGETTLFRNLNTPGEYQEASAAWTGR